MCFDFLPSIEVEVSSKVAFISEVLCIGCGICVKKCPFEAIDIINLPKSLAKDTTHRYGPNSFKLHRLPMPRPGHVLGLVGTNGIGKSTALMILAGKLKPNLGRFDNPPDWQEILVNFRGSELQNFFTKLLEDNIKAIIKPQYVDSIPRSVKGKVNEIIDRKNERKVKEELCDLLDLANVMERDIAQLSGGELQRFAIAVTCMQVSGGLTAPWYAVVAVCLTRLILTDAPPAAVDFLSRSCSAGSGHVHVR